MAWGVFDPHDGIRYENELNEMTDAEKMATELGAWCDKWLPKIGSDDVIKALRDEADRMHKAVAEYEDYGLRRDI